VVNQNFAGNDLGLLQFRSSKNYELAAIATDNDLTVGDEVFAAGFPVDRKDFVCNQGDVKMLLETPLRKGFQIGYSNDIQKGMSGGPILNNRGEVVGINAMHAYPLWGNPYKYEDGTNPSEEQLEEMKKLSWGVAIETFLRMND
jgi:S1-C subfamily serine protease